MVESVVNLSMPIEVVSIKIAASTKEAFFIVKFHFRFLDEALIGTF